MVSKTELGAKFLKMSVVELFPIVRDYHLRYAKVTHYRPLNKVLYVSLSNSCQRLSLYPLSEIVDGHNKEFLLSLCQGKRANDVYSSVGEGLRPSHGSELLV